MTHSRILAIAFLLSLTNLPLTISPVSAQQAKRNSVELIATLSGPTKSILEITFSPGGELLAASSNDGTVRLWNVVSGESLGTIAGQKKSEPSQLSWSGDGRKLAITYRTRNLWELAVCEISSTQPPVIRHRLQILDFRGWSPDSHTFLALDQQANLKLWDAVTGEPIHTFTPKVPPDRSLTVSFVANGQRVLTAAVDGAVELWDVASGKLIATHEPNTDNNTTPYGRPHVAVVSVDGRFFISGNSKVYEAATGNLLTSIKDGIPVSFSTDRKTFLTMRDDDPSKQRHRQTYLTLRTITNDEELRTIQVPVGISHIFLSPNGETIAVAGYEFHTRIFDVATGRENGRLPYGNCWPWQLCGSDNCEPLKFSADGAVLLKEKEPIKLWDTRTVSLIKELKNAHLPAVFSPSDDQLLATRSEDKKSVLLWRLLR